MTYLEQVRAAKSDELAADEHYLAATRLSLPKPPRRADVAESALSMAELRRLTRISLLSRGEPQAIPGFPTAWDMAVGLTHLRLLAWRAQKGTDLPTSLVGAVNVADLQTVALVTVPDRRGKTLALKFVLRNGPRVLCDVVAGYRSEAEELEAQFALLAR